MCLQKYKYTDAYFILKFNNIIYSSLSFGEFWGWLFCFSNEIPHLFIMCLSIYPAIYPITYLPNYLSIWTYHHPSYTDTLIWIQYNKAHFSQLFPFYNLNSYLSINLDFLFYLTVSFVLYCSLKLIIAIYNYYYLTYLPL